MKERPILFSAPMVRALLAGTKTQTRRVVKCGLPISSVGTGADWDRWKAHPEMTNPQTVLLGDDGRPFSIPCPYGKPGGQLWVREAWRTSKVADELKPSQLVGGGCSQLWYEAQEAVPFHSSEFGKLRPSMFMPRWASRITLEVTGVRVERLQDISAADCISEGIGFEARYGGHCLPDGSHFHADDPRESYWSLWEAINGPGSVEANPWVWVISFRRVSE